MGKKRKKKVKNSAISTTTDPQDWFLDAIGSSNTYSKVRVTKRVALSYASVCHAIQLISGDIAKLPIHLYKTHDSGQGKVRYKHPSSYLLLHAPNEEVSAFAWKRAKVVEALLTGNSYSYIFRDGNYYPESIVQLDCSSTWPVRENGRLLYMTRVKGELRKLEAHNVFHVRGLSSDGIVGWSFLDLAKESVGLGLAAERLAGSFFGNGSITSGILEYPQKLDPEVVKQIRTQWADIHSGLDNAHRIAVLDKGVSFKPLTLPNDVSQFLETRKFSRQDIASWFCLPANKLNDSDKATSWNSLEHEQASYLASTLDSWLTGIENEAFIKLLSEREKHSGDFNYEFLREALLKPDIKTRAQVYAVFIRNKIMSPNEVRDRENLPPYDGGDVYGLDTTTREGVEPETVDPEKVIEPARDYKPFGRLLAHSFNKLLRWQCDSVMKASRKPEKFLPACEDFMVAHKGRMIKELSPIVDVIRTLDIELDLANAVDSYMSEVHEKILRVSECSADELLEKCEQEVDIWRTELAKSFATYLNPNEEITDLLRIEA